ncbi:thioesterase II family protein [Nocardia colli]|uniref:thioesterase II family protein n=1 Tax=Nocardia colli TaxID=2545717 RepID=UPI0035DA7DD2
MRPFDRLLDLDDEGLRAELVDVIHSRGGIPYPSLIDISLRVLRADLSATRQYKRDSPITLKCPITVLHWDGDAEIELNQLDGWLNYSERVQIELLSGGHYEVLAAPESLLRLLSKWTSEL